MRLVLLKGVLSDMVKFIFVFL